MDDFSDDGFDDLNDNVLQELENNAINFTQAQKLVQSQFPSQTAAVTTTTTTAPPPQQLQPQHQHVSSDYNNYGFEDDDLDDAVVIDELAQLPLRHPTATATNNTVAERPHAPSQHARPRPPPGQTAWNPMLRPVPPSAASFSSHVRHPAPSHPGPYASQQRAPGNSLPRGRPGQFPANSQHMRPPPPPAPPIHRHSAYLGSQAPPQPSQTALHNQGDLVAALQARVNALEAELTSSKGEVAIVRSKYDKSVTTHAAEVSRLKKQNAEAMSKQERLVEAALAAEKNAATELHFTKQDLKEELQKAKRGRNQGDGMTTPKKNKTAGWGNVADGFDDIEILPSPSKGQGGPRSRGKASMSGAVAPPMAERTPTKGKRKRPMVDSPVMALETEDDVVMGDQSSTAQADQAVAHQSSIGLPYDFLKLALDHSAFHGRPLTFDLFARYSFPSNPSQSLAALIFQKLPFLGSPQDPMRLLIDFCELVLDLWSQCLTEKYHEPIFDLTALVSFILQLNTTYVAPCIISALVPVIQSTLYLVGVPRFSSIDGDLANHSDPAVRQLYLDIDVEGAMQLLYLSALGCMSAPQGNEQGDDTAAAGVAQGSLQAAFWRLMQVDFVLMMLSPKQPSEDFLGILSLLCTSSLEESIGPISSEPAQTATWIGRTLIDRMSHQLNDPPRWNMSVAASRVKGQATYASFSHKQCISRLAILRTFMSFAQSPFGALQLAASDVAIPRLVAVLSGAIDALYDLSSPSSTPLIAPKTATTGKSKQAQHLDATTEDPEQTQEDQAAIEGQPVEKQDEPPTQGSPSPNNEVEPDPTPLVLKIISTTTLLLHTLITDPATSPHANIAAKLAASHGGSQRYQIALARLNFAEEDLILEAGIDADTGERANELLELFVTPDDGESVVEAFGL